MELRARRGGLALFRLLHGLGVNNMLLKDPVDLVHKVVTAVGRTRVMVASGFWSAVSAFKF